MSNPEKSQILQLLHNVMEFEKKKDPNSENKLLHQERLILLTTEYLVGGLGIADVPFNFSEQFTDYTLSVNSLAMNFFNANNNEKAIHFLLKAIDILMQKSVHKFVKPALKYGEIKVLTFNNLGCIYQKRKQYVLALKSVSFAVELEERLIQDGDQSSKNNIISTIINKAAIQSCLNKHNKAQDSLNKALFYIERLEKEFDNDQKDTENKNQQQENNTQEKNKKEISAKKKEGMLQNLNQLKMMCFYNLGVEDEHLFHKDRAKQQYQKSKNIAEKIEDQAMKDRLQQILDQLK